MLSSDLISNESKVGDVVCFVPLTVQNSKIFSLQWCNTEKPQILPFKNTLNQIMFCMFAWNMTLWINYQNSYSVPVIYSIFGVWPIHNWLTKNQNILASAALIPKSLECVCRESVTVKRLVWAKKFELNWYRTELPIAWLDVALVHFTITFT